MNHTVPIQNEQRPFRKAVLRPVNTVGPRHLAFRLEVREQCVIEVPRCLICLMTPYAIYGDGDEFGIIPLKLGKDLVEESELVTTYRTPVSRIEDQDNRLPTMLTQPELR